jgi:hypothetical protein
MGESVDPAALPSYAVNRNGTPSGNTVVSASAIETWVASVVIGASPPSRRAR